MKKIKVLINGTSGVGKDTIKNYLIGYGWDYGVSATTRPKRDGEDESFYHFKTMDDFLKDMRENKLIEYDFFDGNFYGYEKSETFADFFIVAGTGLVLLKEYFTSLGYEVIVVGLTLDRKTQRKRLLSRGDSLASVNSRMSEENTQRFNDDLDHADIILVNEDSKHTATKISYMLRYGLGSDLGEWGKIDEGVFIPQSDVFKQGMAAIMAEVANEK